MLAPAPKQRACLTGERSPPPAGADTPTHLPPPTLPAPHGRPVPPAGRITFKNLKRVAKELGENLTDEEIQEMIDEADRNGDGEVRAVAGGAGWGWGGGWERGQKGGPAGRRGSP